MNGVCVVCTCRTASWSSVTKPEERLGFEMVLNQHRRGGWYVENLDDILTLSSPPSVIHAGCEV